MIKRALNRRGFLRAAPVAVISTPTLVENAAARSLLGSGPGVAIGGPAQAYATSSEPRVGEEEYARDYARRLRDTISGKDDHRGDMLWVEHNQTLAVAAHYDGLRSVSPVRRAQMYEHALLRREREFMRRTAEISLIKHIKDCLKRGRSV